MLFGTDVKRRETGPACRDLQDMPAEHTILTGGLRWGNFNLTWPFVKLEIHEAEIVIRFPFARKVFQRADIKGFSIYRSFTKGIIIRHRVADYPDFVVFWTRKPEEVLKLLCEFMGGAL